MTPHTRAIPDVADLSLAEKVGQLVIARYSDWNLSEKYAAEGRISGMTPMLRDKPQAEVAQFLNHLQRVSKFPLLFGWSGLCYPGGTDFRLCSQLMRIAATRSKDLAYTVARIEAEEARAMGFHLGAAPNLDVNTNPDNPIINLRSLGDNPGLVIELGSELARGIRDGHALNVAMHFPGHGSTAHDSHIDIALVERSLAELESVDMRTFKALIDAGLLQTICTNHCYYPALEPDERIPATLSRKTVTGILRERFGYDGIIFSDSLTMRAIKEHYGIEEGAIRAVQAGHDLILQDYESDPAITLDALEKAVRDGRIPLEQVEASARRVLDAKAWLGLFDNALVDVERIPRIVGTAEHKAVARRIAEESVTVLENRALPLTTEKTPKCLVIANGSVATLEEDLNILHTPSHEYLNQRVKERLPQTTSFVVGMAPTSGEIEQAVALAKQADVVVFGLFTRVRCYAEHGIRLSPEYRVLIERVSEGDAAVVYINLGNPWNTTGLPQPDGSLCAYSDAEDSIDAAVEVLFGERAARGKLPVTLSDAYPFGYGL